MIINLENVRNNYGIQLYRDKDFISKIDEVEFLTAVTYIVPLINLKGTDVAKVYEFVTSIWVERTDVRISDNKLLFDDIPANQLLVVPKSYLSLIQAGASTSSPIEIFVKTFEDFETYNLGVTSLDSETALTGPLEFSDSKEGTYLPTLSLPVVPISFWIKSTATGTVLNDTISLVVTSEIYL